MAGTRCILPVVSVPNHIASTLRTPEPSPRAACASRAARPLVLCQAFKRLSGWRRFHRGRTGQARWARSHQVTIGDVAKNH
jgi:hypothetical protein